MRRGTPKLKKNTTSEILPSLPKKKQTEKKEIRTIGSICVQGEGESGLFGFGDFLVE